MRPLKWVFFAFVLLAAGVLLVSYSWTFTPIGRMDYGAAMLSKIASLQGGGDAAITPAYRERLNRQISRHYRLPEAVRQVIVKQFDVLIPSPEGDIPARVYVPAGEGPFPAMLNIHGGGFFMGNGYVLDAPAIELAARVGMVLVSVDYRLAPEYPFPAALQDSFHALQWINEHAAELNVDAQRIAVMGASAGGNLAAAVALKARDSGGPSIVFQYLSVPSTDASDSQDWPSYRDAGVDLQLSGDGVRKAVAAYLPNPADRSNPYASPLLAESHVGLPPALVVVAQFDPLRDQGIAYAEALQRAGVPVTLRVVDGAIHGFMGSRKKAERNMEVAVALLRERFSQLDSR